MAMAGLLGLVPPFLGPIIYLFFRPPEYLEDVRERELEIRAMEDRLAESELRCPVCRGHVEPTFLVCPICTTRLKQACSGCGRPLEAIWQVCPHCATPVPPAADALDERTEPAPAPGLADRATRYAAVLDRLARLGAPMAVETTLVLVKPDGMRRGLAGEVVGRLERRGYELKAARLLKIPRSLAAEHYAEHKGKPFYGARLVHHLGAGARARRARGENAIAGVRALMGATNPADALPGTIRGDLATELSENIVHGSDSKASAAPSWRCSSPMASCEL